MTTEALTHRLAYAPAGTGVGALRAAARLWFVAVVLGQWAFLYYIVAFYGRSTVTGNFQMWSRNRMLLKGYVAGDTAGNLAFAAHALFAGVIAFGGALQLVPQIRARALWLHRWIGRAFLLTSFGVSLSGFYMNWIRGARQSVLSAAATTGDGLLILIFGLIAWRTAMQHDVVGHRRWALRTFIVANGQWFVRVGYVAWMIVNHGHDRGFYRFWDFGCYLVPLAVLELYLWAKDDAPTAARYAVAALLVVFTLLMAFGSAGLTVFLATKVLART